MIGKEELLKWLTDDYFDDDIRNELLEIKDDIDEVKDRFYKELEFGTGGMRGKIGAGSNRINRYTIGKATQGLANILNEENNDFQHSVVIAYDPRYKSKEFAKVAAKVLAANEIKVYLFKDLRSTPELSFAVRHLGCSAGIVITASHNPPQYNGYKVYGRDGGQLTPNVSKKLIEKINKLEYKDIKKLVDEQEKLINIIGKEVDDVYISNIKQLAFYPNTQNNIKIIYTPLHGTGNIPVRRVLDELGYNVKVVEEQENPDPEFTTVDSPNPEEKSAFDMAIKLAIQEKADIIIGTDPDCDRVGVVVKNKEGRFVILNGNQTGALLLDYILKNLKEKNKIPSNGVVVKTIVTSELGRVIAKDYGIGCIDTLTGFKFIGEKIKEFEEKKDKSFIFGYEESLGYLTGTFVRDKDAVISSMLICEMASYYKDKGLTLLEALDNIYLKHAYYVEETHSLKLEGILGQKKINKIMDYFRERKPQQILDKIVYFANDYKMQISYNLTNGDFERLQLPKSNVLKFIFEDGSWFVLRPSGTEPKIKLYFSFSDDSIEKAKESLENVKEEIVKIVESII